MDTCQINMKLKYTFLLYLGLIISPLFPQTEDKEVTIQDLIDAIQSATNELQKTEWRKGYYTDSFGEPTDGRFINSKLFSGYFSDTIATREELNVRIQVDKWGRKKKKIDIDLVLFKYGTRQYKSDIFPKYQIKIKHNGTILRGNFIGIMSDGKVSLNNAATLKVHQIFLEGGDVSFILKNLGTDSSFRFSIYDIDNTSYKDIFDEI